MSPRRKSMIAVIVLPVVLLLSLVSVGVANARTTHPDSAKTSIDIPTITIRAFAYTVPTTVQHGVLIKVVNQDGVPHTVTSNIAGKFHVRVPAHSSRNFRAPGTPGNYGFHCNLHAGMKAVLRVR